MGLAPLVKKPNLVIFLNAKNIKAGLKECKKFRIPTIILIESRQSTLHTSYKLPCSKNLSVR
jgi:ribosomal protein S2